MASPFESGPGIYDNGGRVVITPEERAIGLETHRYFEKTLKREKSWHVQNGIIRIRKSTDREQRVSHIEGVAEAPEPKVRIITREDMAKERLSDPLGNSIDLFKGVEDHLGDFMQDANIKSRSIWGVVDSYNAQWGVEEQQHSVFAGMAMEATGFKTAEEIEDDYYRRRENVWSAPYPTLRQVIIYAGFQEPFTKAAYEILQRRAIEEGALNVAEGLGLIARDEGYHGGGYRVFSKIFAKYDPEGAADDAEHVLETFRMPAEQFIDNGMQAMRDLREVGYRKREVARKVLMPAAMAMKIIPEERARAAIAKNIGDRNFGLVQVAVPENMPTKSSSKPESNGERLQN
jgi:hypothetical protein